MPRLRPDPLDAWINYGSRERRRDAWIARAIIAGWAAFALLTAWRMGWL
jgi:hypothetical protein